MVEKKRIYSLAWIMMRRNFLDRTKTCQKAENKKTGFLNIFCLPTIRILFPSQALTAAVAEAHIFSVHTHFAPWTYGICISVPVSPAFCYLQRQSVGYAIHDRQCIITRHSIMCGIDQLIPNSPTACITPGLRFSLAIASTFYICSGHCKW